MTRLVVGYIFMCSFFIDEISLQSSDALISCFVGVVNILPLMNLEAWGMMLLEGCCRIFIKKLLELGRVKQPSVLVEVGRFLYWGWGFLDSFCCLEVVVSLFLAWPLCHTLEPDVDVDPFLELVVFLWLQMSTPMMWSSSCVKYIDRLTMVSNYLGAC
jgi:hypothetical protein